ncbi:anti-sigma factor [Flavobacterium sp.]|uniref:anti-sigma factor n=1 Tax=Flavobacterium sp. TaxID=239 RepID=UPI00286A41F7|nr:anti-sigma factor [Flavobacterium sp.]
MTPNDYIESGDLELYVYGLLSESESEEIAKIAKKHKEIDNEIIAIEKAIVNISTSFSPFLSVENFEKIKAKLDLKYSKVIPMETQNNRFRYLGWAAAAVLLIGIGYEYTNLNKTQMQVVTVEGEKVKLEEALVNSEIKYKQTQDALAVVRDVKNTVVTLGGQAVSPTSYAKVYYNKETQVVYVDAAGLPEPPEGKVYQVWALKLNPLTPTSIGLLDDFSKDSQRLFAVSKANGAEAFGITLEPAGGSVSPTMEQLYTLGKV